jgi:endonuclease YncB( thermonuclease family)
MKKFKVTQVIDGDTFDVTPKWKWSNQIGERVRPTGYDAPELNEHGGIAAKTKLQRLISGKQVELKKVASIDRGRLVCDVYFNGRNLSHYFPEYQT